MPSTLAERILSRAAGRRVRAGEVVGLPVDRVMLHDSLAPSVIQLLEDELGGLGPSDPERLAVVIDHVAPAANPATAQKQAELRRWVKECGIRHFFESGRGIAHQVLIEERLVRPGMVVVGTDSHSTSYGAVGAFGTGMGSTDVAFLLATGATWMRVPETLRIRCRGSFPVGVGTKDLALHVIGRLTARGAVYAALEYHGLDSLSIAGRTTLASMAVEVGAKAGLVVPRGLPAELAGDAAWLEPDAEAHYAATLDVDLARLRPVVARPGAVDDVCAVDALEEPVPVDVVYLGTCTNGRHEDMAAAAGVLRGRPIAPGVRFLVVPASQKSLQAAVADGTVSSLLASGATLGPPGCGACIGRHMGVLAPGEVCVFTGNRNFVGRMGSPEARIFLASPEVAAAAALTGNLRPTPAQAG